MKKVLFVSLFLLLPVFCLAAEMVDINSASLSQLDTLTGIGPVYAQRIIDGRPYSSIDDLDRVKGIGPATIQKIKDQGLACVNCATTPTPEDTPLQPTATEPVYPTGIYINEILPNPEGADETEEWIELYNSNNFEVDLTGWQIKDSTGSITNFIIPQNTKILANGFLVFKRPITKIMLNNESDGINLLTPDQKIIDSVEFLDAPLGLSYSKSSSSWLWTIILTPGATNIINASQPKNLPKTQKTDNNSSIEALGEQAKDLTAGLANSSSPWPLFLTVLVITIILSIIVLLIKFKLK